MVHKERTIQNDVCQVIQSTNLDQTLEEVIYHPDEPRLKEVTDKAIQDSKSCLFAVNKQDANRSKNQHYRG